MRKIIASIDIGTNSIKIIVGEILRTKLHILAVSDTPCFGLKKGLIIDAASVIKSLKEGLKKVEEMIGQKIKKAVVSVPSYHAEFKIGEGVTTVTNPDRVVTATEIIQAMQASIYNRISNESELINCIPTIFKVNEDTLVKDPKGIVTTRLEVKTVIVTAPKKNVQSVLGVMEQCGIKVVDIAFNTMADYYALKNKNTENSIGAIINLGHETTTIGIYNKGIITNTETIDLGSNNIDNDIVFIYKITSKDAKYLKENFALCHKRFASAAEIEIMTNRLGEEIKINQYELSEIVASRIEEILNLAKKQINLLTKKEISYIILTGGLTEAKDFGLIVDSVYGKNAQIGNITEIGARNNKYSTSLGLIKYYDDKLKLKDKEFSIFSIEELEEFATAHKRVNVAENSLLGKVFGYFFDN